MKTVIDIALSSYVRLTNQTPTSRYGMPVLVWGERDLGPADIAPSGVTALLAPAMTAGEYVLQWAGKPERTAEEARVALLFLGQQPESGLAARLKESLAASAKMPAPHIL